MLVVGGYAATIGLVALLSVLLALTGAMPRSEAVILSSMIGFPAYAAIVLWGWAQRSFCWLSAWMIGTALVRHGAAILLARLLPTIVTGG